MTKIKKTAVSMVLILCITIFLSITTVFAQETSPYGAIIETVLPGKTISYSKTEPIYVSPYGTTQSKQIGTVTIGGKVTWDEIWEVDQNGNKIRFIERTNRRFLTAKTDYSLKLNCSISSPTVEITTDGFMVEVNGWGKYSPPVGVTVEDEYFAYIQANSFV